MSCKNNERVSERARWLVRQCPLYSSQLRSERIGNTTVAMRHLPPL